MVNMRRINMRCLKILLILLLTISFNSFFNIQAVYAQPSTGQSEATINFSVGDTSPPVLDPTDPTIPYEPDPSDPTDPQDEPTGNTGPLTLDYVSSVHFGNQVIS